jgi:hypothetical protein
MSKYLRKSLFFYLLFSLFLIQMNYAQDENNKWIVGIGANAIDYFPSHAPNTGNDDGFLNQLFNSRDHWNISGPQIMATRHLVENLSVDGLLAFNHITKYGDVPVDGTTYIGIDINFRYSLLDTSKDFTIFLLAGGGYTFAFYSGGTVNTGIGVNYWFNNKIGLNFESMYKYNSSDFKLAPHFYYGLSLVYKPSLGKNNSWRNCN